MNDPIHFRLQGPFSGLVFRLLKLFGVIEVVEGPMTKEEQKLIEQVATKTQGQEENSQESVLGTPLTGQDIFY